MANGKEPINAVTEVDKVGNPVKKHLGLTKREYFTAMAMQGYISSCDGWCPADDLSEIAKRSVIAADQLITQLNKPTTND